MKARSLFRRIICVALGAALAGSVVTGCKKGDDMFPSIVTESSESSASEVTDETGSTVSDSDIQHIRVALPYSDQTIQYLASMLYCKNNGIWDSAENGLTVDTGYLASVASNYVITNTGCGSTGAELESIKKKQKKKNNNNCGKKNSQEDADIKELEKLEKIEKQEGKSKLGDN